MGWKAELPCELKVTFCDAVTLVGVLSKDDGKEYNVLCLSASALSGNPSPTGAADAGSGDRATGEAFTGAGIVRDGGGASEMSDSDD